MITVDQIQEGLDIGSGTWMVELKLEQKFFLILRSHKKMMRCLPELVGWVDQYFLSLQQ